MATSIIPSTCAVTATAIGSQLSLHEGEDDESVKVKFLNYKSNYLNYNYKEKFPRLIQKI